jgi:signal transduction histidine kinase
MVMDHTHHGSADAGPATARGWADWFDGSAFMPHGHCYFWEPGLLWLHVASDVLIAVAYYSIPLILFAFVSRRRDVPFNWMFILFGVFIMACGTTHILEVVTVWTPIYWISGGLKALTALVSLAAAAMLVPIIPKALALPSLRTANEELQRTTRDLRRTNQELEQFAYVASHDLQEPLRMVGMYLELARRELPDLDPKVAKYLGYVDEGAQRMKALIDSLLEYSRIDAPPAAGAPVADGNAALAEAIENLRPAIASSGTHVTTGDMPRLRIDPTQLVRLFQNLIGNAIKYGTTDRPWVHVSATAAGAEWVISVQDNGIGIDPQYHKRIFEVFQRLHDRRTFTGTGIGLAICKKIVDAHGGRIWVESQPGVGSIFHAALPGAPA